MIDGVYIDKKSAGFLIVESNLAAYAQPSVEKFFCIYKHKKYKHIGPRPVLLAQIFYVNQQVAISRRGPVGCTTLRLGLLAHESCPNSGRP